MIKREDIQNREELEVNKEKNKYIMALIQMRYKCISLKEENNLLWFTMDSHMNEVRRLKKEIDILKTALGIRLNIENSYLSSFCDPAEYEALNKNMTIEPNKLDNA